MAEKMIELECAFCGDKFNRPFKQYKYQKRVSGEKYKVFCSNECQFESRRNRVKLNCHNCGKLITRKPSNICKHNYCGHACAIKVANDLRRSEAAQGKTKESKCITCGCDTIVNAFEGSKTMRCSSCRVENEKNTTLKYRYKREKQQVQKRIKEGDVFCKRCKTLLLNKGDETGSNKKYCHKCRHINHVENGIKIAAKRNKRSKNEIYFAVLCSEQFSNVTCNERYFDSKYGKWDADVILHDLKIAVLWNGIFHYQQVFKGDSLKQIQTRDKIKMDVIVANGYYPYVVKDMGKFNPKFVNGEFEKLLVFLETYSVAE